MLEQNHILNHREKNCKTVPNSNILALEKRVRRNSDIAGHRDVIDENVHFRDKPRAVEERHLSAGALIAGSVTGNNGNMLNGNILQPVIANRQIPVNHSMYASTETTNSGNDQRISHNNMLMGEIQSYTETILKNFSANKPEVTSGGKAIIMSNEIVRHKEQNEPNVENAPLMLKNTQDSSGNTRDVAKKQCPVPDVEQFLQTNIIVNKHQPTSVIRGSVLENFKPTNVNDAAVCDGYGDQRIIEKVINKCRFDEDYVKLAKSNDETHASRPEVVNSSADSELIENNEKLIESQHLESQKAADVNQKVVSSTVIIKDTSMEVSRGDVSRSKNKGSSGSVNNQTHLDDVVLERVSPNGEVGNGISYTSDWNDGARTSRKPKKANKAVARGGGPQERLRIVAGEQTKKFFSNYSKRHTKFELMKRYLL